jgi:DNA-directed RNA polymerase subunit RPC12/RpoP
VPTKYDSRQLALFPPRPALPSRPFSLEPTARDETLTVCSSCGRVVVVSRTTSSGLIESEYLDRANRCFQCSEG